MTFQRKEEESHYRRRLEEGFHLQHDGRYNLWRKTIGEPCFNPPEGAVAGDISHGPSNILLNECPSLLQKFFPPSPPTLSKPPTHSKTSAKVLTSSECRTMEEKERLKRENQERREQERERKREMKEKARKDKILRGWFAKISFQNFIIVLCFASIQDRSSDTEYLPQRGHQARERRRIELATHTDQDEQNDRPFSTELRVVRGRGRCRGIKEVTVPAPNNAHSGKSTETRIITF